MWVGLVVIINNYHDNNNNNNHNENIMSNLFMVEIKKKHKTSSYVIEHYID